MAQRRNDELVAYPIIAGIELGPFNELPFPEKSTENAKFRKPLKRGEYSAGGPTSYDDVEATRVYDPDTDDALIVALQPLEGDAVNGAGSLSYHDAPGYVPALKPIANQTYEIVLLTIALTDGVNTEGGDLTMLKATFGINGVGK